MYTAILHATQILLATRAADTVSLDEIAATAGISRHHLRAYFTSPAAVLRAVRQDSSPASA